MFRAPQLLLAPLILLTQIGIAQAQVRGQLVPHASPNGVQENCVIVAPMPEGHFSQEDRDLEKRYCAIDLCRGDHALCAKTFSTSPGTLIYDISGGSYRGDARGFEASQCYNGKRHKSGASGDPISYKMTMNAQGTSATFATSSVLYYQFSRYLHAYTHVPVSVFRGMDRREHLDRVSRHGLKHASAAQNRAGWMVMVEAEKHPESYPAPNELFNNDRSQVYGVLLEPRGKRYSAEVNGTRESGWGEGQSRDFQETAPFRALRSSLPLFQAIEAGTDHAWRSTKLRKAMKKRPSTAQMIYWMQELTEITLLDFIFSQQDRVGNIDYLKYWHWVENGRVKRARAQGKKAPGHLAGHNPVLLKRTQLNDNDAGGHYSYSNFTKKTQMLEKIRHYNAGTYRRLMRLDADLASGGTLHAYLKDNFGLTKRQFDMLVKNTHLAAGILRETCRRGELRFDLDPDDYLATGQGSEQAIGCD